MLTTLAGCTHGGLISSVLLHTTTQLACTPSAMCRVVIVNSSDMLHLIICLGALHDGFYVMVQLMKGKHPIDLSLAEAVVNDLRAS